MPGQHLQTARSIQYRNRIHALSPVTNQALSARVYSKLTAMAAHAHRLSPNPGCRKPTGFW